MTQSLAREFPDNSAPCRFATLLNVSQQRRQPRRPDRLPITRLWNSEHARHPWNNPHAAQATKAFLPSPPADQLSLYRISPAS